jgi:transposase
LFKACTVTEGDHQVTVMIGIDPHKASHTASAIDAAEIALGEVRVRANDSQLERLLGWAQQWPQRTWAVENSGGLGYLLAQQLLAAGQTVLDVPPKLAARVRLLNTGDTNKNDPNDARSVAIAAPRSPSVRPVAVEDHQAVMKLWAKRHRDLNARRTQVVCRLHAVLCELIPGGAAGVIRAAMAVKLLEEIEPEGVMATARYELACEHVIDLLRLDEQLRQAKKHMAMAVKASKTTLTGLYGIGPYVAATVKGEVGDVSKFASRHHFAAYNGTAPIEVSSGPHKIYRLSRRGNRRLNHAIHMAAVTQIRFRTSPGRAYYDRKRAEGKSGKEAIRALKRRISDIIYAALVVDARLSHSANTGPGGQKGNDSKSKRDRLTPQDTGSSDEPLPDPHPHYDPPADPDHNPKDDPKSVLTNKEDSIGRTLSVRADL